MSQPGRRKGENLSAEIKEFIQGRGDKWTSFATLTNRFGNHYTELQIKNSIYNLAARHGLIQEGRGSKAKYRFSPKAVKAEVGTAIHEQVEAYIAKTDLPQVALDVRASQVVDEVELPGESSAEFQLLGELYDGKEYQGMVAKPLSQGWGESHYLIRPL